MENSKVLNRILSEVKNAESKSAETTAHSVYVSGVFEKTIAFFQEFLKKLKTQSPTQLKLLHIVFMLAEYLRINKTNFC